MFTIAIGGELESVVYVLTRCSFGSQLRKLASNRQAVRSRLAQLA